MSHDSVTVFSLNGRVAYWSDGAQAVFGWTAQEAMDALQDDLLATIYPVSRAQLVLVVISAGSWEGELVRTTRDGRTITTQTRWSLLRDAKGGPVSIVETSNDISARRAVEVLLDLREARNRNLFQAAGVALWEIDFSAGARRIEAVMEAGAQDLATHFAENPGFVRELMGLTIATDVNDACMRMHGATAKEQLLGPVDKVWPPEGEAAFARAVLVAMDTEPYYQTEAVLSTLDGALIDVLYSTAYPPEALSLDCLFVAFLDITARNRAQADLQTLQAELAHTTRLTSLGELTASLAHEINQPLGGILSNSQAGLRFLRRREPDVSAAIEAISSAIDEARRAGSVLKGIRALASKGTAEPETMCLNAIIEDTVPLLRHAMDGARVEVRIDLDAALSPVRADRVQIQQVLINLMMNAMQAMAQVKGAARRLVVSTSMADGSAVASVVDNGPGIAPDVRGRLFDAFVTTCEEGMGLGLSLCASIIGRHGGQIWVDEDPPAGAGFRFSLPAVIEGQAS